MYKRVLLALDLEGVNNVVGEPYSGLSKNSEPWEAARRQAALEINAAVEALCDAGVEKIDLWDNHGGGGNIIESDLDERITLLTVDRLKPRMYFAEGEYDCICYFGYHTMEGTLGGVLAHTMSSISTQYYKINGSYVGEIDMDVFIASSMGIHSCFFAGGDITCRQAKRVLPEMITVETKTELSRNSAIFRDNDELFADIKRAIVEALNTDVPLKTLSFPCSFEKSFKRVEDAAKHLERVRSFGIVADYPDDDILGKDAHTVVSTVNDINEFRKCI